jgi:phosphate starvation-inducible PhoH-like protein
MFRSIYIESASTIKELFGELDKNIKDMERKFNTNISISNDEITINGSEKDVLINESLIYKLLESIQKEGFLSEQKFDYLLNDEDLSVNIDSNIIVFNAKGQPIKAKTKGQSNYIQLINKYDITFGIGPAGTGKTYLAVCMAIRAFKNKEVSRIIITRPAVEAGEKLGFLPGDLQMKIDPYLRPVYDALYDVLGAETFLKYKEKGLIEIAPLAYMRGRTLDNSFIILDEAQNTTKEQMKMFLTRFGFGSRIVINGDITQIDLPKGINSGLINALKVLKDINEIGFMVFDKNDVVRHKLVKKILASYERFEIKKEGYK